MFFLRVATPHHLLNIIFGYFFILFLHLLNLLALFDFLSLRINIFCQVFEYLMHCSVVFECFLIESWKLNNCISLQTLNFSLLAVKNLSQSPICLVCIFFHLKIKSFLVRMAWTQAFPISRNPIRQYLLYFRRLNFFLAVNCITVVIRPVCSLHVVLHDLILSQWSSRLQMH